MFGKRFWIFAAAMIAMAGVLSITATSATGGDKKKPEKKKEVWTDPGDPSLPADFKFQGEYVNKEENGCQVIALGAGTFQAVMCKEGLPGAGWNGKDKALLD